MSSPAYTMFCRKGHILANVASGDLTEYEFESCPHCLSREYAIVWNWKDERYEQIVPAEPLNLTVVYSSRPKFPPEPRYDMSNIPMREWELLPLWNKGKRSSGW